jgi:hypothetical protein
MAGGPGGPGGPDRDGGQRPPPPPPEFHTSEEEWTDVSAFLQTWSPNRLAFYNRMGEMQAQRKANLRRLMTVRYRQLQQISEADKGLYDLMVQQLSNEDQALGVAMKLRRDEGDKATLEAELKEIVKKIVANSLQERQKRIAMLKDSVEQEETTLDEYNARSDELVQKRFEQIVDHGPDALLRERRGGPSGGGGFGGGRPDGGMRPDGGRPDGGRPDGARPDGGRRDGDGPKPPQ